MPPRAPAHGAAGALTARARADVKDPKQIQAAFDETVDRLGPRLFVSVANAGVTQVRPLLECTPECVPPPASACVLGGADPGDAPRRFIENEVRINVLGFMNTHIAAAKQMVKQGGGGRIIGAGSIASYRTASALGPF